KVEFRTDPEGFLPYLRDPETLSRPWAIPGTPGLEHRIGGLSSEDQTGNISYSPANNELMVRTRARKIAGIAREIPATQIFGDANGGDLVGLDLRLDSRVGQATAGQRPERFAYPCEISQSTAGRPRGPAAQVQEGDGGGDEHGAAAQAGARRLSDRCDRL